MSEKRFFDGILELSSIVAKGKLLVRLTSIEFSLLVRLTSTLADIVNKLSNVQLNIVVQVILYILALSYKTILMKASCLYLHVWYMSPDGARPIIVHKVWTIRNYWKLLEIIRNYSKLFEIIRNYSKLFEIIRNYSKLFEIIRIYSNLFE